MNREDVIKRAAGSWKIKESGIEYVKKNMGGVEKTQEKTMFVKLLN